MFSAQCRGEAFFATKSWRNSSGEKNASPYVLWFIAVIITSHAVFDVVADTCTLPGCGIIW